MNLDSGVKNFKQKEPRKVLHKLKHYVCPENPLDGRVLARLKRGAIHYAQVNSWWSLPPVQRWIRKQHFQFDCCNPGATTHVKVSGDDITHLWVADEVLIERVYRLDSVPFTPDVVLDLGANIGLFTLLAAQRWPGANFVCVEPHPTTFSFLCENLALNGVRASKLQCAMDATVGVKCMENEGAVFQSLCNRLTPTAVMTLQLHALIPSNRDLRLLIKMDIEGSEVAVLDHLGATLPQESFVFIELHDGDRSLRWIHQWAENNGFEFREVRRREEAIDGCLLRPHVPESRRGERESEREVRYEAAAEPAVAGGVR
jgi:FkbM family methyltransferase